MNKLMPKLALQHILKLELIWFDTEQLMVKSTKMPNIRLTY